jgi:hypothetical protein
MHVLMAFANQLAIVATESLADVRIVQFDCMLSSPRSFLGNSFFDIESLETVHTLLLQRTLLSATAMFRRSPQRH